MFRLLTCAVIASLGLAAFSTSDVQAQKKKKVDILKKWSGSVADQTLMQKAPAVITGAKSLEAIWKLWKIKEDLPKVDFDKEIVIGVYSVGSRLNLAGASLNELGDLSALGFGTRDIAPGFRYVLAIVSRDGVKTVNGKKLPKD